VLKRRQRERHSRTSDDQIGVFKQRKGVRSRNDVNALRSQPGRIIQFSFRLGIVDRHARTAPGQKLCRRDAAARQTDNQNVFAIHLHARASRLEFSAQLQG
jgi:hypothetical protein